MPGDRSKVEEEGGEEGEGGGEGGGGCFKYFSLKVLLSQMKSFHAQCLQY